MNTFLDGKSGDDYLEGGKDFDTYIIQGKDTVLDTDREGKLVFVNMDKSADETPVHFARVAADQNDWVSVDEKKNRDNKFTATRINDDLVISQVGSDNQATIKQYFKQKEQGPVLGVQLFDDDEPVAPDMGDGFITGMPGKENVYSFNSSGSFKIKGTDTRDSINAGPLKAKDEKDFALVAYTGAGNDSVFGSFERDWIDGGDDADLLNGSPFVLPSKDWRDPIKKAKDSDTIIGGGGGDFINGMAGDDVLYANMQTSHLEKGNVVSMEQGDWVLDGEGDDRLYGSANQDFLQGGEGSDTVIGDAGNDTLYGGIGKDKLIGGAGSDILRGGADSDDYYFANSELDENTTDTVDDDGKTDHIYLDGSRAADLTWRKVDEHHWDSGQGWKLAWYGGRAQITYADKPGIISIPVFANGLYGINLADSSSDDPVNPKPVDPKPVDPQPVEPEAGRTLYGTNGDDTLLGGNGDDQIFAGAGNDLVFGRNGNDKLYGDEGNDELQGGDGERRTLRRQRRRPSLRQ